MVQGSVEKKKNTFRERYGRAWLKKGSASALYYLVCMWIIVLAAILFSEYFHYQSNFGRSQLLADLLADGSVFIGDNGWGLEESKATSAYNKLAKSNKSYFKDQSVGAIRYSSTTGVGKRAHVDYGKNKHNTGTSSVKTKVKSLSGVAGTAKKSSSAKTRITYVGGMRIVMEAWKHTYEKNHGEAGQTAYVWGGGHSETGDGWENYADCSGFVSGVFRTCGYYIPPGSCTWDMEDCGQLITTNYADIASLARPGDIILYWYSETGLSQHVVIYAGMHNGMPYVIEMHGGSAYTAANPGRGASLGCHINPMRCPTKLMVRRIVDSEAKPREVPKKTIPGLNANESDVMFLLYDAGFNATQIGAIMGNAFGESGVNPFSREGIGPDESYAKQIQSGAIGMDRFCMEGWNGRKSEGYGLFQWTTVSSNYAEDRKAMLWQWAKGMNGDVTDIRVQISYAIHEMETGINGYNHSAFKSYTDVDDATKYFLLNFEGIEDSSLSKRQAAARRYEQLARSNLYFARFT